MRRGDDYETVKNDDYREAYQAYDQLFSLSFYRLNPLISFNKKT